MAQVNVITAKARPSGGKGAARTVRRTGCVPGVVYGGDVKTAETITIDGNELGKLIKKGRFLGTVFEIDIDGTKTRAIPRDVQLDPVMDHALHVDFQRIGADNRVRIRIPMHYVNEAASPGLKRGGVLNIVRREVEVWAPSDNIPDHFEADLTGLEIGRSIHISAVKLPDGVVPTITNRDFTVATIAGSAAMKPDPDEVAAAGTTAEGAAPAAEGAAAGDAKAGAGGAKAGAAGAKAPAAAAGAKGAPAAAAKPDAKKK